MPLPQDYKNKSQPRLRVWKVCSEPRRVRLRPRGNRHFVDVTISVPRTASFEQVHEISDAVERRVGEILPADVMVHMEPARPRK